MIHTTLEEDNIEIHRRQKDGTSSSPLEIALEIDRYASSDSYFVPRGLRANADLHGSLLYTALGFEVDIVDALARVSRIDCAMAH